MKTNKERIVTTAEKPKTKKARPSVFKQSITGNKIKYFPLIVSVIAIVAIGGILLSYESEYLFRVQELNLFIFTPLFFKQCMVVAGGMLTYIGSFFTQFFYHQWIGVSFLCLWWALMIWLLKRTFKISNKAALLLIYPVVLLLLTDVYLGYWIFYLKMRGHFFASTIGFATAIAAIWTYRSIFPAKIMRPIWIILSTAILYPLIGFYSLLATLNMAIIDWKLEGSTRNEKIINTLLSILSIIFIPLIYYRIVYYQTNIINIYWQGLPLFRTDKNYPAYYIPYIFLSVYLIVLSVFYKKECNNNISNIGKWIICQIVQIIVIVTCTYLFWYKDQNFRMELAMNRCIENLDWEGVLKIARDETNPPTRLMVMNKNLALFRLGRAGDEMYHYLDGAQPPNSPFLTHMMQVGGKMLYLNYGKLNFCYRWCIEDGVEYGWRVDFYRYLIKCSLLNGELKVARKYIDILKNTLYYRNWAEKYERYLRHPSLIKKDKEFQPIIHMLGYDDQLDSDQTLVEMYLLKSFAHSDSNDPLFQEETLLCALQMKDISLFWPRFTKYAILHPHQHMPIHYQEAAMLYGNLEHKVDISHMPFDQEVRQSYKDFMALAGQCAGMTEEQMMPIFYPQFGNTFYYNYFFIRNLKSY